ncbi:hypothetical protein [Pseudotenacibaculum haliotis]|uniref:DUF4760 domain-containing protein n=1 Tax=Pseudotenacibaculum haliotis TaxID=1862138 RepID=A0ABW5LPH3_9FLAO
MEKLLEGLISTPVIVVAVIGVLGNWLVYQLNKRKEIAQREQQFLLENLKGFWEKQSNLYSEALKVSSVLVFTEDIASDEFTSNYKRFWELYWSELPTCESYEVELAMVKIGEKIKQKASGKAVKEMGKELYGLSTAIRDSSLLLEYSEVLRARIKKDVRKRVDR